jgi:aspartokinase
MIGLMGEVNILEFESSAIQDEAGVSAAVASILNARPKQPLVLVAGMGKTEQRLLEAGEKSAAQDLVLASTLAEGARTFYMQVARQLTSEAVGSETQNLLSGLFEECSNLLEGVYLIGELSPQGSRMIQSYAERASCIIVAQALKEKEAEAQPVGGRQIYFANSAHLSTSLQERSLTEFQQEISLLSEGQIIPVIPLSLRSITTKE